VVAARTKPTLGWNRPGVTTSGYVAPFDTWASMPQDGVGRAMARRRSPAYGGLLLRSLDCGVALPQDIEDPDVYVASCRDKVLTEAVAYLDDHVGLYLPGAVTERGFVCTCLVGANGHRGRVRPGDPVTSASTSIPRIVIGSRFRDPTSIGCGSDESGYDNLVLGG